jgi:hypothetical protein
MLTVITQSHIDRYSLPDFTRVEHTKTKVKFADYGGYLSRDCSTGVFPYSGTSYSILNTNTGESTIVNYRVPLLEQTTSSDGSIIIANGQGRNSELREVRTGSVLTVIKANISKPCWSLDNRRMAYEDDSSIVCMNVETPERLWTRWMNLEDQDSITAMSFSDDGSIIVVVSYYKMFVVEVESGRLMSTFDVDNHSLNMICVSPDNRYAVLFSCLESSTVSLVSLEDGSALTWVLSRDVITAGFYSGSVIVVTEDGVYDIPSLHEHVDPTKVIELVNVKTAGIAPPNVILM